jgi:hypothetical protein
MAADQTIRLTDTKVKASIGAWNVFLPKGSWFFHST